MVKDDENYSLIAYGLVCGQPVLSDRIVGGQASQIGAWPWQVSVGWKGRHYCSGSLVAQQWVVSAAHCFTQNLFSDITVTLGAHQLANRSSKSQSVPVAQVIRNIAFDGTGTRGDIALLRLQRPMKYTPYILPVCVPFPSAVFPEGMACFVTGWGYIGFDEPLPSPQTLQQVQVSLIDVDRCNKMFNVPPTGSNPVTDDMICAGYKEGGKDACQGDSGGPLVCAQNDSWFLVGIVSWGQGCALPYRPGVYTRVTSYGDWLQRYIPGLQFGIVPIALEGGGNPFGLFTSTPLVTSSLSLLLPFLQWEF
ncbi:serine protease 27-like [Zootoca vivipara]|uniref:serine protease 27-like n=1 Tax=Zootoca vivipara TaxID=8524 RepID=UPI00293B8930|nr:serine protease 27-like [Zootoca vivipara]